MLVSGRMERNSPQNTSGTMRSPLSWTLPLRDAEAQARRRVAEVLSAIMVDIGWSPELLLPEIRIYEISQAEEVITNIRGTVQRLTKQRMTDDAYTALFAIIAACAPVASSTRADHILKRYLGVRDDTASHYATAFEARDRFDDYHNLQEDHRVEINVAKGRNLSPPPPLPMLPGQRVTCIAGKGTLDKCDDAGCVVHLDSCDDKLYYPHPGSGAGGAQLKHLEPSLLPRIRRKERNKHKALKALILNWHENSGENPRSPNTKDICKRRLARGHVVQARTIHRFLTFRGLWDAFRRDHPNLSARLCARDKKTGEPLWDEVPTLFRTNVPWNMKRGKDKGCLCLSCEELGVKARAQVHVARRLEDLLAQWTEMDNDTEAHVRKISQLAAVLRVISKTSKCEMCAETLNIKPGGCGCLPSKKLENTKPSCESGECPDCGFDKVRVFGRGEVVKGGIARIPPPLTSPPPPPTSLSPPPPPPSHHHPLKGVVPWIKARAFPHRGGRGNGGEL
jgi:hypothetical protein